MKKTTALTVVLIAASFTLCCESDLERRIRLEEERQERFVMEREQAEQLRLEEAAGLESNAVQGEQRQLEEERQLEEQREAEELRQLQELEAERAQQQQVLPAPPSTHPEPSPSTPVDGDESNSPSQDLPPPSTDTDTTWTAPWHGTTPDRSQAGAAVAPGSPAFPGCEFVKLTERTRCTNEKVKSFVSTNLKYPENAKRAGIQGTVLVSYQIDKHGNVVNVEVVNSPHEYLIEAALEVVRKLPKHTPGFVLGEPTAVSYAVPVLFTLN